MGFISNLIGGGAASVIGEVGNVIDKFNLSPEQKNEFKLQMEALLQKRDSELEQSLRAEMEAKERVTVAELAQGDNYTKRARPSVVYAGLAFIFLNYCVIPAIQLVSGSAAGAGLELPSDFWWAWGGVVGTWSIGRSFEKAGASNSLTRMITGSSQNADDAKG